MFRNCASQPHKTFPKRMELSRQQRSFRKGFVRLIGANSEKKEAASLPPWLTDGIDGRGLCTLIFSVVQTKNIDNNRMELRKIWHDGRFSAEFRSHISWSYYLGSLSFATISKFCSEISNPFPLNSILLYSQSSGVTFSGLILLDHSILP